MKKIVSVLLCLAVLILNIAVIYADDDYAFAVEEAKAYLQQGIDITESIKDYRASNGVTVTMTFSDIYDNTIADEKGSYQNFAYLKNDGSVIRPQWYEGTKKLKATAVLTAGSVSEALTDVSINILPPSAPSFNSEELTNYIDIGNEASENGKFECIRDNGIQTNSVDGTEHTYRTLNKNGAMVVTMKCDSEKVNYLTVKLWGNDTGDTMLWVCDPETGYMNTANSRQPTRNSLVDRRDWVELNFVGSSPQYNGGFIYATYMIPTIYTKGKEYVSLRIYSTGGKSDYSSVTIKEQTIPSRGIYAVYMTQEAMFNPEDFETVTGKKAKTAEISAVSYEEQKLLAEKYAKNSVEIFKSWQIYGQDNYPSYMEGMVTRSTSWKAKSCADTDWKDCYYSGMLKQNMTPLNMYEIFAVAYKNSDVLGYDNAEKAELLDRIVKGVDFLVRAQGSNGGFYSANVWIGGPEREESSGNHLTGFGLRSVPQSVLLVYDDIVSGGYFDESIDSDADGTVDKNRKTAWAEMMSASRDFLVSLDGAGHAPNQDMADIIAALRFEKTLRLMNSSYSWKSQGNENEVENQLDMALGFKINKACSSYWVSPKGLILENFGSIQGGYSGDYGTAALAEISQLVELAEDYYGKESKKTLKYTNLLNKAYDCIDNFMFVANSEDESTPTLYAEGLTGNRNSNYPGVVRYILDEYTALEMGNKTALKNFELFFKHNRIESDSGSYSSSNAHFEDNALEILKLYLNFDKIIEKLSSENISGYNYLMENESVNSYAWADEMGRNVVIKNGGEKIYIALNWRSPIHSTLVYNTEQSQNHQKGLANNLARVHHINDTYDRYGYAEVNTNGWNVQTASGGSYQLFQNHYMEAFMYMKYGNYRIMMNSNNLMGNETDIDYEIPVSELELDGLYKDLISGEYYYFGDTVDGAVDGGEAKVKSASTMVLCKTDKIATEPSPTPIPTVAPTATPIPTLLPEMFEIKVTEKEYKNGVVRVALSTCGADENGKDVYVYVAEYSNDGKLRSVTLKKQNVQTDMEISFSYKKISDENLVKIFVWNDKQKPYDSVDC